MRHDPVPCRRASDAPCEHARLDTAETRALMAVLPADAMMPLPSLEVLIDWAAEAPCDRSWSEGAVCRRAAAELWRDGAEGRSALRSLLAACFGTRRARGVLSAFEQRLRP